MSRWTVLLATCLLCLLVSSVWAESRPNVLWICADDFAPYVCGAYGNRQVRTPNIDRLAAGGMRFDRAYCNSPVCTASRQSFLTGRYPRTIGVTQLRTPLPASEDTVAELLKESGYTTAAIGKMHFNSNLTHGFDHRVDMPDYNRWLKTAARRPVPETVEVLPVWRPFRDHARVWLNSFTRPYAAHDDEMAGTFFARQASSYLAASKANPFFLMVSFYEPHSPFHFPIEFRGRHDPKSFAPPVVVQGDEWQIPAIFRDLTDAEKQGIITAYHTSVEYLDRNVGLVLDALQKSGRESNTLVILTGDHGYMLGQHGRFEKHCSYEEAIRSPLLVKWPQQVKAASRTNAMVEFVDIAPTLLDACGAKVPSSMQGRSLLPLLKGQATNHRKHVIVEYAENEEAAIRTERYKLVYSTGKRARQDGYETGRPSPGRVIRLYDEENDPSELMNIADQPEQAARVAELTRILVDHLKATARRPERLPPDEDPHKFLEVALQPDDVQTQPSK